MTTLQVLKSAISEIRSLRRDNEVLAAKAYVVDVFAAALMSRNGSTGCAREDPLWQIELRVADLEAADKMQPSMEGKKSLS